MRFDDGTWFVGVISSVEQRATGDGGVKLQLRVQFEDGDSVESTLPDEGIVLLAQEWTDHVQSRGSWGWWGFNTDRVECIIALAAGEPLPPAAVGAFVGTAVGKGKRAGEGVEGGALKRVRKAAPTPVDVGASRVSSSGGGEAVPVVLAPPSQFQERMRGLPNCFFKVRFLAKPGLFRSLRDDETTE